jgi:hypothetical protein
MFVSIFLFDKHKQRLVVVKIDRILVTFALLIQINESAKLHNIGTKVFLAAVNTLLSAFSRISLSVCISILVCSSQCQV